MFDQQANCCNRSFLDVVVACRTMYSGLLWQLGRSTLALLSSLLLHRYQQLFEAELHAAQELGSVGEEAGLAPRLLCNPCALVRKKVPQIKGMGSFPVTCRRGTGCGAWARLHSALLQPTAL